MSRQFNRRQFIGRSLSAVAGVSMFGVWSSRSPAHSAGPNEKLNIACIGTGNRATANNSGVADENIVALCDIDERFLARAGERFTKAQKFHDFRKVLDLPNVDAVVISTADHTHAPAAAGAMRRGLHVYCEKPLTHTVYEARVCARLAQQHKVATQMGTQIHAGDNYRRVVELVQSGAVGPVREAHAWVGARWHAGNRPRDSQPVPSHVHWDLWLGPAPKAPYHSGYHPEDWRRYWDFGGGTLADMGCHLIDLAFWALDLRHPVAVEAEGPQVHPEGAPSRMKVEWKFAERGDRPPVRLYWYHGDAIPQRMRAHGGMGVLFVGDEGELFADYGRHQLLPEEKFKAFEPPERTIPASLGHYAEWIKACKDGSSTTCNFDYSGALTETVLLGNVAYRVGKKLTWDAENLRAANCPEADQFIQREYRQGWTLEL